MEALMKREGRTRFSWLRGGYELVTKNRNQLVIEEQQQEETRRGGYEVVTPSVTAVTLGVEIHNAGLLQTNYSDSPVRSRAAFFSRTRCKARRLIKT